MKRSSGCGGALGVTANAGRCAVIGCFQAPKPQVCPYDGAQHRHGAIHYDCGSPVSSLAFHAGDWYWVCDAHYAHLVQERAEFVRRSS